MACDLDKYRRRIKWEKRIPYLCAENASIGFNRAESISRDWWLEWDEAQTDSDWLWLDGGFLLTEYIPPSPSDYSILRCNPSALREIEVLIYGYPYAQEYQGGRFYSVLMVCVLTVFAGIPPVPDKIVKGVDLILGPNVTDFWQVAGWASFFPPSPLPPPINGRAILTPLDACHQCASGS